MENEEIRKLLGEEIKSEIEKLSSLKPGSEEHKAAVDSLAKLYKLNAEDLENERAFMERCDRDLDKEREWKLKNAQLEEEAKNRRAGIMVGIATAVLTPIVNVCCNKAYAKMLCNFEKDYTFTTTAGKALSRLFSFKK